MVRDYIVKRRDKGVRGQTIVREVQCLRRALKIAKRHGLIASLPDEWPTVKRDPQSAKNSGKLWSPTQIQAVLAELDEDARDELLFALYTGLRSAELKRVEPSWLVETPDAASPAILMLPGWATKSRKERVVGLAAPALEILSRRIEKSPRDPFVFSQANHKKARRLASQRIKLSTTMTLRDLRHTFASMTVLSSGDLGSPKNAWSQRPENDRALPVEHARSSASCQRIHGHGVRGGSPWGDHQEKAEGKSEEKTREK